MPYAVQWFGPEHGPTQICVLHRCPGKQAGPAGHPDFLGFHVGEMGSQTLSDLAKSKSSQHGLTEPASIFRALCVYCHRHK